VAVTASLAVATVSGILIVLGLCYRKKSRANVKGKIHLSVPLLMREKTLSELNCLLML